VLGSIVIVTSRFFLRSFMFETFVGDLPIRILAEF